jgi:hypothetical protein
MVDLVPPAVVDGKFQLEDKSNTTGGADSTVKRPAPKAGGCRVEGFVRVKKVHTLTFLHVQGAIGPCAQYCNTALWCGRFLEN